ncbi:MAG: lipocalin-like domain-containing protein [Nitrospinaceae bacterium]|nr:lipocalin-like domain-containing protein [Nitrospinaceae bacterium]MDP7148402.1 lipocalin-like domain-containing protein [Nitrospinaceae bacterium]
MRWALAILILPAILLASLNTEYVKSAFAAEPSPFRQALPGYAYQFPRDMYSHDDFQIEWWYYTGNLEEAETARPFGYQLTFFRVALDGTGRNPNPSKWNVGHVYFAHMTLTDVDGEKFHFFERINRKGMGNAGAHSRRLMVWNEDWFLTDKDEAHWLKAVESGTGINLRLVPEKKIVIHGKDGISKKGRAEGNASHYFSYTRMKTSGTVFVKGKAYKVMGTSWMDREYSSDQLNDELAGWDWFSLKLDDRTELMLYQLRRKTGGADPFSSGTLVSADGTSRHIRQDEFVITSQSQWTSKRSGITYPAGWKLELPGYGIQLTLSPDLPDQELHNLRSISASYWEGSVTAEGTINSEPIKGKGYVELVGYGKALKQDLPD